MLRLLHQIVASILIVVILVTTTGFTLVEHHCNTKGKTNYSICLQKPVSDLCTKNSKNKLEVCPGKPKTAQWESNNKKSKRFSCCSKKPVIKANPTKFKSTCCNNSYNKIAIEDDYQVTNETITLELSLVTNVFQPKDGLISLFTGRKKDFELLRPPPLGEASIYLLVACFRI